jgi:hypothetical protein
MGFNSPGAAFGPLAGRSATTDAPMVVVFERDDAIAVPLLSQLRLAGYDVRGARTPVELFDTAQKHTVALMLVDLGNAAASRREFWVALDAQRRGRAIQVLTYRVISPDSIPDTELDVSASALADVELRSPFDLQLLLDAVRQKLPLHGGAPLGNPSVPPLGFSAALGPGPLDGFSQPPYVPDTSGFGNGFSQNGASSNGYANAPGVGHMPAEPGPAGLGALGGSGPFGPPGPLHMPPGPPFSPFGASQGSFAPAASSSQIPSPIAQEQQSPFAHPASENPFTGVGSSESGGSPFTQPFNGNPFAAPGAGQGPFPSNANGHQGAFGGGSSSGSQLADAWVPPTTGGLNGHVALQGPSGPPTAIRPLVQRDLAAAARSTERPAGADLRAGERGFPTYDTALQEDPFASGDSHSRDATAPVSIQLPAVPGALMGQGERALGSVLVEGALISPRKLEVLKDIQRMLSGVDVDFNLGELALLFKFLSPDQLLAALLVSRGVVSPQQIAGLGRIKQELSASGMDYDLETLLVMFHVLPAEELRELRRELA